MATLAGGLSRFRTLYRYDQRGCGLSDWEVSELSFDSLVSDLETVVDAAALEQFDLFAMSQGGSIAIAYTASLRWGDLLHFIF